MKVTLATAALVAAIASAAAADKGQTPTGPLTPITPGGTPYERGNIPEVIKVALDELNKIRRDKGLKPVCLNSNLQNSAQDQSNWMAKAGTMDHRPDTFERFDRYGYAENTVKSENIAVNQNGVSKNNCFSGTVKVTDAYSSAKYTTSCAWYNSEGHYKNMMNPDVNQVGIAYTKAPWKGAEAYYWTQNFGRSALPCLADGSYPAPAPAPKPAPAPAKPAPQPKYPTETAKPAPKPTTTAAPQPKYPTETAKPQPKPTTAPGGKYPTETAKPTGKPTTVPGGNYPTETAKPTGAPSKTVPGGDYPVDTSKPTTPAGDKPKKCKKWIPGGKKTAAPTAVPTYGSEDDKDEKAPAKPSTPGGDYGYGEPAPTGKPTATAAPTGKPAPGGDYGYGEPAPTAKPTAAPTGKPAPGGEYGYGDDAAKPTTKPTVAPVSGYEGSSFY